MDNDHININFVAEIINIGQCWSSLKKYILLEDYRHFQNLKMTIVETVILFFGHKDDDFILFLFLRTRSLRIGNNEKIRSGIKTQNMHAYKKKLIIRTRNPIGTWGRLKTN